MLKYFREAELTNGRWAMAAVAGILFTDVAGLGNWWEAGAKVDSSFDLKTLIAIEVVVMAILEAFRVKAYEETGEVRARARGEVGEGAGGRGGREGCVQRMGAVLPARAMRPLPLSSRPPPPPPPPSLPARPAWAPSCRSTRWACGRTRRASRS